MQRGSAPGPGARRRASVAHETVTTRLMGGLFAVGSICFVIGPLTVYSNQVSSHADAMTFLVGSICFTGGGLTQAWLTFPERRQHRAGRLAWGGAWIQAVGTLLFNLMAVAALSVGPSSGSYDSRVWAANALGSICFLASGALLYASVPRHGWRPQHRAPGWWEPPVNLLGCVLFGISALTGYATAGGELVDLGASNWTTSAGAVCFLAVGLAPLIAGMSFKVPRLSRWVVFERALVREIGDGELQLEVELRSVAREIASDSSSIASRSGG